MCKVGGPRCDGSHRPSATQRAKRKANTIYRRQLADYMVEEGYCDEELAGRIRKATMTDLYEIQQLAAVPQHSVKSQAHRTVGRMATKTTADGETAVVDIDSPGQTRHTPPSEESKQLFADVFEATKARDQDTPNEYQQALINGDRETASKLIAETNETAEWIKNATSDVRDMTDDELMDGHKKVNERYRSVTDKVGEENYPEHEKLNVGAFEAELARRGLRPDGTRYSFDSDRAISPIADDPSRWDDRDFQTLRELTSDMNFHEREGYWRKDSVEVMKDRAMYEELSKGVEDTYFSGAYNELIERAEHRCALSRENYRYSDAQAEAVRADGRAQAALWQGRDDTSLSEMYNDLEDKKRTSRTRDESDEYQNAKFTLESYFDNAKVENDNYARSFIEISDKQDRDPKKSSGKEDMSSLDNDSLVEKLRRKTELRSSAYVHSTNPEVRSEADSMAGPAAEELARRAEKMDDLTGVPAYLWPQNTEGKKLPSSSEMADQAELYYGLRDVSKSEADDYPGASRVKKNAVWFPMHAKPDSDGTEGYTGPEFKGVASDGSVAYRVGDSIEMIAPPSGADKDIPLREYLDREVKKLST